jgi:hypothetical protein
MPGTLAIITPKLHVPAVLLAATTLAVLTVACTSSSAPAPGRSHPASRPVPGPTGPRAPALAREGLLIPATYQQACASESAVCVSPQPGSTNSLPAGPVPAALNRPLHFPDLQPGQRCPASPGRPVNTSDFGGIALGNGPVRVLVGGAGGDIRQGVANLINPTSTPPWLGLKTLWFSAPSYQGPFVIRAIRLGHPGPVALGEGPMVAPLVVPPGPTVNGTGGWREAPGGLWVKKPGCYAWQVDGLTFSETIVVHAVLH